MTSKFMKSVKKHLFEIAVVFHCSEKKLLFGKLGDLRAELLRNFKVIIISSF